MRLQGMQRTVHTSAAGLCARAHACTCMCMCAHTHHAHAHKHVRAHLGCLPALRQRTQQEGHLGVGVVCCRLRLGVNGRGSSRLAAGVCARPGGRPPPSNGCLGLLASHIPGGVGLQGLQEWGRVQRDTNVVHPRSSKAGYLWTKNSERVYWPFKH